MIKLLAKVPYGLFYVADLGLSVLTFGDHRQTISARLWEVNINPRAYVRYPFVGLRWAVDAVAYTVFGESYHCKASYDTWIAIKTALGLK